MVDRKDLKGSLNYFLDGTFGTFVGKASLLSTFDNIDGAIKDALVEMGMDFYVETGRQDISDSACSAVRVSYDYGGYHKRNDGS
jgi:hypothetical protein